jgi:mannose-6-phosphate isomerase-like protein (cupin superfamily)
MQIFQLPQLLQKLKASDQRWLEFLRVSSLSVGVYHLRAGEVDPQKPHKEDEVYYVARGQASFRSGSEEQEIGQGSVIFVEKNVEHRFFDITEDLTVLVFFAPPEGSLQQ